MIGTKLDLCFGFHQGANALGAQHFAHHASIFHDMDGLKVGAKGPLSSLLRPWTIETKGGLLTAMSTLSHSSLIPFQRSKRRSRAIYVQSNSLQAELAAWIIAVQYYHKAQHLSSKVAVFHV